jgi:hypothetical protein
VVFGRFGTGENLFRAFLGFVISTLFAVHSTLSLKSDFSWSPNERNARPILADLSSGTITFACKPEILI